MSVHHRIRIIQVMPETGHPLSAESGTRTPTPVGRKGGKAFGASYYRARYYDPPAGRFISQDATMSGINFYTYVGGNVTGYVDPFGYQRNQKLLAACAADASLNFGLGFVPGYNFLKLGLNVFHISVNPFQAAGGFAPLVQLPETAAGFAAGIS